MAGIVDAVAGAAGVSVEVRSAHGPWFTWAPDASAAETRGDASSSSSSTPWWLRWLKPEVIVRTTLGTIDKAPAGKPDGTTWPLVPLVLGGVLVLVLTLAGVGVTALLRRR